MIFNRVGYIEVENISPDPVFITYEAQEESFIDTASHEDKEVAPETQYYGQNNQISSQAEKSEGIIGEAFIAGNSDSQTLLQKQDGNALTTNLSEELENTENNIVNEKASENIAYDKASIRDKYNQKPKERKTIADIKAISAPIRTSTTVAKRIGQISFNVKKTDFGAYEQQLLEAISYKVDALATATNLCNCKNGIVEIKYLLNDDGVISNVTIIKSNVDKITEMICQNSIITQSPFRKWTQNMSEKYGENRVMQITFVIN